MKCDGGRVEMQQQDGFLRLDVGNNWRKGARLEWQQAFLTKKQVERLIGELQAEVDAWKEAAA